MFAVPSGKGSIQRNKSLHRYLPRYSDRTESDRDQTPSKVRELSAQT
jgi:hypothetical protein